MTPAATSRRDHRRGTLYMVLVVMIWGGFLPAGKSALEMVDPYWLTAMRFGTAALVFIGLLLVQEGRAALVLVALIANNRHQSGKIGRAAA